MPSTEPLVSIVIPNWNGAHLLPVCLNSLVPQTYRNFEILVVDNASTDSSREMLARDYPTVRVVALETNRGFAGGVNAGIRAARGEIIALLNNDTEAGPGWLAELVAALARNPRAGMAASKLRLYADRDKLHSAGDFYRVEGVPGNRGVWEADHGQYDDPDVEPRVFGACAGACAYRKTMLDEIGLFDEGLVSYCEDVDLNWRARLAGYDCEFAPNSIVYHMVSATGGGARASYYVGRNFILVLAKNYPAALWRKYRSRIVGAQLRIAWEAVKSWRGQAARARLRGQIAGLAALPAYLRKRRQVQANRRASDQKIEDRLAR
ncbi:MAG: glycosyltransferase family 2 protein [Rudaea sp.]